MYEVVTNILAITNFNDLHNVIDQVKSMTNSDNEYVLRLIYTGPFFTHAEETIPIDDSTSGIHEFFDTNFSEEQQNGVNVIKHKLTNVSISGAVIVKIVKSEREAIIADIVKNSAIN